MGRKLFNLDAEEGDASDEEDAEHLQGAYKVQKKPARGGDAADLAILDPDPDTERDRETTEIMGRARGQEQQRERAERLRRYHALMELLTTEVGYLFDLRALVTVRSSIYAFVLAMYDHRDAPLLLNLGPFPRCTLTSSCSSPPLLLPPGPSARLPSPLPLSSRPHSNLLA